MVQKVMRVPTRSRLEACDTADSSLRYAGWDGA
jgi:hypothetical protein